MSPSDVIPPEVVLENDEWVGIHDVLIVLDSRQVVEHELVTDARYEGDTGGENQECSVEHLSFPGVFFPIIRHFFKSRVYLDQISITQEFLFCMYEYFFR